MYVTIDCNSHGARFKYYSMLIWRLPLIILSREGNLSLDPLIGFLWISISTRRRFQDNPSWLLILCPHQHTCNRHPRTNNESHLAPFFELTSIDVLRDSIRCRDFWIMINAHSSILVKFRKCNYSRMSQDKWSVHWIDAGFLLQGPTWSMIKQCMEILHSSFWHIYSKDMIGFEKDLALECTHSLALLLSNGPNPPVLSEFL